MAAARVIGLIMITIIRIVSCVVIILAEKVLYRNSIGLSEQKVIVSACTHIANKDAADSVRLQIILFWNGLIKRIMRPLVVTVVVVSITPGHTQVG